MLENSHSMVYKPTKRFSLTYIGSSACMYIVGLLNIISFSSPYWLYNNSTNINQVISIGLWEVRSFLNGCKFFY